MNCDQAFDCLTDSSRRHSPQLEEHLARCRRCREMEATLEPALDLFDDLVPEPDLSSRTATARTIAPESVRVAEQAASRLLAGSRSQTRRRGSILPYAAAVMVGALLMGVMGSINDAHSRSDALAPVGDAAKCIWRTGVIDRQAFTTSAAVTRRCVDCHTPQPSPIDDNAQPISIEMPADIVETTDLIVRVLTAREHANMIAAGRDAVRWNVARMT